MPIYDLYYHQYSYGAKDYFVQDNILAICNYKYYYFQCAMYDIYDLSKITKS